MTKKDNKKKKPKPKPRPKPKPKPSYTASFTAPKGQLGKHIMNIAGATLPVFLNYMSSGRVNLPHVSFK